MNIYRPGTLDRWHGTLIGPLPNGGDVDILSTVTPGPDSDRGTGRPASRSRGVQAFRQLSLAVAIYGMAVWIYVAICSLVVPDTLALPLTHLLPGLREDTSGVISFIISFLGFVSYRITRPD